MEWFALLIPVILCVAGIFLFKRSLTWWEVPLPVIICALVIMACKGCVKSSLVTDTEHWGSLITRAEYVEYYETWVTQTCSRQVPCGEDCTTDANGRTTCTTRYCTEYYDCSYCDRNDPYWIAYDDAGNSFGISREYYEYLIRKWNATPLFVELNRDIDYRGGCGKDGDKYVIKWDGRWQSSEAAVTSHTYTNKVQASHSAFRLPYISPKEAKQLGLYPYPEYKGYKQQVVLGLDSIYSGSDRALIETKFQYFNGYYGARNKVKLFVLLFYDKPLSITHKQEAYWSGGNQNELIVCIGLNRSSKQIEWVRPFSWTDRKRVLVDIREDIAEQKTFQPFLVYDVIERAITNNIMYKDFKKDFNYLEVDLPRWAYWLIYILTFVFTLGTLAFCIGNDINNERVETDDVWSYQDRVVGGWRAMKHDIHMRLTSSGRHNPL